MSDRDLHFAYLRLREIIGHEAFKTPHAPSPEQVWETTEKALQAVVAERDALKRLVDLPRPRPLPPKPQRFHGRNCAAWQEGRACACTGKCLPKRGVFA